MGAWAAVRAVDHVPNFKPQAFHVMSSEPFPPDQKPDLQLAWLGKREAGLGRRVRITRRAERSTVFGQQPAADMEGEGNDVGAPRTNARHSAFLARPRNVSALRAMFEGHGDGQGKTETTTGPTPDTSGAPAPKLLPRRQDTTPSPTEQGPSLATKVYRVENASGQVQNVSAEATCGLPLLNGDGSPVAPGRHPDCRHMYYCGKNRVIPGSDGICGNRLSQLLISGMQGTSMGDCW